MEISAVLYTSEDICHWMEQYLPSLIKNSPYFLLVSCDSTVCSLWKISGGRKGERSPPPSDNTLRWPVFDGLVALRSASTGVSDGGTVTAEVKQRERGKSGDWLKGRNHVAIHCLVLIGDPWGRLQVSSDWMVNKRDASDWRGCIHQCLLRWWLGEQPPDGVLIGRVNRKRKQRRSQGGQRSSL